ncbi:hypothetical protein [Deinococcus sp. 12RED42]|nr:hypothetical protein [Deinococcus sp. 12RED42]
MLGADVSGFDAILPPPRKARALRARRPVLICGQVKGGTLMAAD